MIANQPPTAVIAGAATLAGQVNAAPKVFDGSPSTDGGPDNGTVTRWDWTFTDPQGVKTTDNKQQASKTFTLAGQYTVVLKVTDNLGAVNSTAPIQFTVTQ